MNFILELVHVLDERFIRVWIISNYAETRMKCRIKMSSQELQWNDSIFSNAFTQKIEFANIRNNYFQWNQSDAIEKSQFVFKICKINGNKCVCMSPDGDASEWCWIDVFRQITCVEKKNWFFSSKKTALKQ